MGVKALYYPEKQQFVLQPPQKTSNHYLLFFPHWMCVLIENTKNKQAQ